MPSIVGLSISWKVWWRKKIQVWWNVFWVEVKSGDVNENWVLKKKCSSHFKILVCEWELS